jgi:nicotinic acid mononucleotide adenylyltransferase
MRAQLWVLPVFQHAFASKSNLAPFEHRLRMCELGLATAAPGVRVLDTERQVCEAQARGVQRRGRGANAMQRLTGAVVRPAQVAAADSAPARVGSIDVLDALCAAHPDVRWSWVLGAAAA